MFESATAVSTIFKNIFVKRTTRQQHPLSAWRYSIKFRVSVTCCLIVMFVHSGLNISDGGSLYTQNIMNVHTVYDTDSMALPTAAFPDSISISFLLDTEEKVSYVTLRQASQTLVLFFLLKPLPVRVSFRCRGWQNSHQNVSTVTMLRLEKTTAWDPHFLQRQHGISIMPCTWRIERDLRDILTN
jgi:hypothetical protein